MRTAVCLTAPRTTLRDPEASSLIASGVRSSEVYQSYIPAVSRYLGEMWVNDRASFVDVSLGSARLQALLREAGRLPCSDPSRSRGPAFRTYLFYG